MGLATFCHDTFCHEAGEAELVSLDALVPGCGTGSALLAAVAAAARSAGAERLVVVTTNDNLDALRFYQRRDLRLRALRPGAVAAARRRKPAIPLVGSYGIAIRDELELVLELVLELASPVAVGEMDHGAGAVAGAVDGNGDGASRREARR